VDEAEDFIEEHQGNGWLCFTCTGTCACQAAGSRGLTRIEAHKRRGWVGVTGGGLAPSDRQPRLSKRATRGDAAAEAEAAAPAEAAPAEAEEEEEEEGPPGFVMVAKSAPASPALPTAPRLEVPTPERDDAPTAATPSAPPPPSAPAKRKRPAVDAAAAAPAKRKRPAAASAPTPAAPGAEGAAILGRRVEAWWDKYKCYFPGVLKSYDEATGVHTILYDHGVLEEVTLPDDTVRYEMATMA
jgi:hypothetical protein